MAVSYTLLNYEVNVLTEMLMRNYGVSYAWALRTVTQSNTYKSLIETPWLQEEGDLYVYEMLEKELADNHILQQLSQKQ